MIKNRDFCCLNSLADKLSTLMNGGNQFSHRTSQQYHSMATFQKSASAEIRGLFIFNVLKI